MLRNRNLCQRTDLSEQSHFARLFDLRGHHDLRTNRHMHGLPDLSRVSDL